MPCARAACADLRLLPAMLPAQSSMVFPLACLALQLLAPQHASAKILKLEESTFFQHVGKDRCVCVLLGGVCHALAKTTVSCAGPRTWSHAPPPLRAAGHPLAGMPL